jgi:hypothetical protein
MKKRSLKTTVAAIMLGAALCLPVVSAHATEVTTEAATV